MAERQLNVIVSAVDRLSKPAASMTKDLKAIEAAGRAAADTLQTRMMIASTAVVAAFAACAYAAADYGEQLIETSQKTGMAVEELGALKYAAEQSGVGFEEMRMGLTRMQRAAFEAARGSKEQADTFRMLGVAVQDASGGMRSGTEIFRDVAERIAEMDDPTARAALAMRVFGRSGAELLPLLQEGGAGIDELMQRAEKLGLVMSDQAARDAEEFGDAIDDLKLSAKGVAIAIGEAAFGTTEYAKTIAEAVGGVSTWIREHKTAVQVIVGLAGFVTTLTIGMYGLNKAVGMVRETMGLVNTVLGMYKARVAANAVAVNAETAALAANTTAQGANAVAARAAGAARGLGGGGKAGAGGWAVETAADYASRMAGGGKLGAAKSAAWKAAGMKGAGSAAKLGVGAAGIGSQLSALGTAAAGAAIPLAVIAAAAAAIYLWKRNIDVAVDTHRLYNETITQTNERLKSMGEEALNVKVGWRDWLDSLKAGGPAVVRPSDVAKQRAITKEAGQAVTKEQTTKALDALRAEGGGMTPREKAEAAAKADRAAAAKTTTAGAAEAAQAAAAAAIPSTSSAVAAMPEAAMDLWRSMEGHLSRLADGLVGAPSREGERVSNGMGGVGAVGTRRQVPGAGGPITVQLVMDSRVIAQQVIALERGRAYGYP